MALIASCTEVSTVRFCLVVRFLTACFLAEALPCTLRFAEIVFDFARAVLLAAVFFLFAADPDFDLAWLCVFDDFCFDGVRYGLPMFERGVLLALRLARFAEPAMKRTPSSRASFSPCLLLFAASSAVCASRFASPSARPV